jgi:subtilisin-like proprotein convertase family protein
MPARSSTKRAYLLAAILVVGFGSAAAAKAAHYGGDCNIPILDSHDRNNAAITEAVINIPEHFVISDLDVRINITHTNIFDLQLFLENPTRKRICLNSYDPCEFFDRDNYVETIFDDEAITPIEEAQPPFTGRFKPISPNQLSKFDGEDAFGDWHLQIYDLYPANTGTLDSFELIINVPEPSTALLLALAAAGLPYRPRLRRSTRIGFPIRK